MDWGITGAFVFVVSIPRLLDAGERLLVSQRSDKLLCFDLEIRYFEEAYFNRIWHDLYIDFVWFLNEYCDNFKFVWFVFKCLIRYFLTYPSAWNYVFTLVLKSECATFQIILIIGKNKYPRALLEIVRVSYILTRGTEGLLQLNHYLRDPGLELSPGHVALIKSNRSIWVKFEGSSQNFKHFFAKKKLFSFTLLHHIVLVFFF